MSSNVSLSSNKFKVLNYETTQSGMVYFGHQEIKYEGVTMIILKLSMLSICVLYLTSNEYNLIYTATDR